MQRRTEYVLEYDVAKALQWFLARFERESFVKWTTHPKERELSRTSASGNCSETSTAHSPPPQPRSRTLRGDVTGGKISRLSKTRWSTLFATSSRAISPLDDCLVRLCQVYLGDHCYLVYWGEICPVGQCILLICPTMIFRSLCDCVVQGDGAVAGRRQQCRLTGT